MKACTKSQRLFLLATVLMTSLMGMNNASAITIQIDAYIDGRDQLIYHNQEVLQWHHFDFAAVGRHYDGSGNEPTILDFGYGLIEWYPSWPEAAPAEIRYEAFSGSYLQAPT
jgi:hypothetical protein